MSETLEPVATEVDQQQLAEQLLAQAKEQGVELVGPNGWPGRRLLGRSPRGRATEHGGSRCPRRRKISCWVSSTAHFPG